MIAKKTRRVVCWGLIIVGLLAGVLPLAAQDTTQDLPPCGERPTVRELPWVDTSLWCLETVIADDSAGEMAFVRLAVGTDGTLYATRPFAGQVLALTDTDHDGLPDTPQVVADNLTLPNGLAYHAGALYISGGSHIYRLVDDTLKILVDDLPSGAGFWTGGLTVGADDRLYVAVGAPCDFCEPIDSGRGAILSFALDGRDRQVVASGLRNPADVAWYAGSLWTLDTARDGLLSSYSDFDELNRVTTGAHFGWPYCIGVDNQPDFVNADFACADATPPAFTFATHSTPVGLTAYTSSTFPNIEGALLVVLQGTHNIAFFPGYTVVAVHFDAEGYPSDSQVLIPMSQPGRPIRKNQPIQLSYYGRGFWPHHPFDVAVSPEGWLYISSGGGQIWALRPY